MNEEAQKARHMLKLKTETWKKVFSGEEKSFSLRGSHSQQRSSTRRVKKYILLHQVSSNSGHS